MPFRILVIVLALAAPAHADPLHTGPLKLHEAAEGVYAVEAVYAGANAAVIVGDRYVTVVDTHGSPASAAALSEAIAGLTDKPVRYVINTHWHVDHHAGNAAYVAAWPDGVSIVSHANTREDIPTLGAQQFVDTEPYRSMPINAAAGHLASGLDSDGKPLSAEQRRRIQAFHDAQQRFVADDDTFEFTLANLTIERALTIHDGANTARVLYLHPAHTRGDLVVWIPERKVLVVGDLLTQPILWTWSSYPQAYVRTLDALEALGPEQLVIGHGGPLLQGTGYLHTVREFLEAAIAYARQANAEAVGDEQALAAAAQDPRLAALQSRFVSEPAQAGMYAQMVQWTVGRALAELRGELDGAP